MRVEVFLLRFRLRFWFLLEIPGFELSLFVRVTEGIWYGRKSWSERVTLLEYLDALGGHHWFEAALESHVLTAFLMIF